MLVGSVVVVQGGGVGVVGAHDVAPLGSCASGSYDAESGRCVQVIQTRAVRSCPGGYSYSASSGLCERPAATAIAHFSCPGYARLVVG